MRKHLLSVVVLRHKAGSSFLGIMAQLKVTKTTQGDIVDDAPVVSTKQPQRGPRKGVDGGFVNFQRCGVLRGGRGPQAPAALQAKENRLLLKEQAVLVTRTRIELVLQP